MRARLSGFGFWTPGYADVEAWAAGGPPDEGAAKPDASVLPSRLRRRTALLTRMACHVIARAADEGEADLEHARLILSSAWGEFETTIELLQQLAEPEPQVSPTLFHNSVHNTATGYLSIALGNREASTAIGAGRGSLRVGLIEALCELAIDGGEALLVVGDEHIPPPFSDPPGHGVAVALCLRPSGTAPRGRRDLVLSLHRAEADGVRTFDVPATLVDNPCAIVLALARLVVSGESGQLPLGDGWLLDVATEEEA